MTCDALPSTGADAGLGLLLIMGLVCLVSGTAILLARRRRRRGRAFVVPTVVMMILVVSMIAWGSPVPAQAQPTDCVVEGGTLIITQTSTLDDLAPGTAPELITGLVFNNSRDDTYISAVDVAIHSVTTRSGTPLSDCDASDYVLRGRRMRVERALRPGGSTPFTGASIGFYNKTHNQDACQGATIHLHYTANPR